MPNPKSEIRKPKSLVALVTGTFAEPALRDVAGRLRDRAGIESRVIVLNIQVAALMTADWVARKLELPPEPPGQVVSRVILPGYCRGDVSAVSAKVGVPVELGPRDLHDLPELFGQAAEARPEEEGRYDIEILAEINEAPRLAWPAILALAQRYRGDGAEVIDLGCDPMPPTGGRDAWPGVADAVRALRDEGFRVSIDSLHPGEIRAATGAGAELVLSVNSSNREHAADWGAEVVAMPDDPSTLAGLEETIAHLAKHNVRYRIDPILEPIGLGFAASLGRYLEVRRRYPDAAMMMGVGNLTELTQVDSAGVNALLIGFCQELGIASVLTTEVINWARSSVREIDVARRMMRRAVRRRMPPKHGDRRLVMLRDPRLKGPAAAELTDLAGKLTDRNLRLFVCDGRVHAINRDFHVSADDAMTLLDRMIAAGIDLDASHAYYLGYEAAKAMTALALGKNYTQDEALRWGMLTREEQSRHAQ
ncbi:MAG: DUF6513 domain-containing protein [Phycisphaeraceae bacterium]